MNQVHLFYQEHCRIATAAMEHGTPLQEALNYAQEARRGCLD